MFKGDENLSFDVSSEVVGALLDWRLQFDNVKALVMSSDDEEMLSDLSKKFGRNNFEGIIFTNLKNNAEIREYIDTHEPDMEMVFFLENALIDMIVPMDTVLIFNNAHTCEGIWALTKWFHTIGSNVFVILTGDFSDEQLKAAEEDGYAVTLKVPGRE